MLREMFLSLKLKRREVCFDREGINKSSCLVHREAMPQLQEISIHLKGQTLLTDLFPPAYTT
jgi:hypothetical protein